MTPAPPTSELAVFVTRMLDADEAAARAAADATWTIGEMDPTRWGAIGAEFDGLLVGALYFDHELRDGEWREGVELHIARHDPARVLAQVAAMRTILRFHDDENGHDCPYLDDDGDVCTNHFVMPGETCDTLLALAAIWADSEAFDPAWSA